MHNTDQTKDDVIETGFDILLKAYEYYQKRMKEANEQNTTVDKYSEFEKTMEYVIENSDDEEVKSLASALKAEPEDGLKVFNLMNDKAKLIGLKEAKNESDKLVAAINEVSESNLKSDSPSVVLQEEIDKLKSNESAKMIAVKSKIEELEKKNYSSLEDIKDERIQKFMKLANEFSEVEQDENMKDKLLNVYNKIVETGKLKKEILLDRNKESKEQNEENKELEEKKEVEKKKERKREVELER